MGKMIRSLVDDVRGHLRKLEGAVAGGGGSLSSNNTILHLRLGTSRYVIYDNSFNSTHFARNLRGVYGRLGWGGFWGPLTFLHTVDTCGTYTVRSTLSM